MKVVIDTNVLVSAVLRDRDPEAVIMFMANRDDFEWIVSKEIMTEYREVLSRPKFGLPQYILHDWYSMLDRLTVPCTVDIAIEFPRDRKDAKFLSCAVTAGADYFITGDSDFKEARQLLTTTILSVSQFKKLVSDRLT
jgi:putative PIN family toxin of toxin-antitoxin system